MMTVTTVGSERRVVAVRAPEVMVVTVGRELVREAMKVTAAVLTGLLRREPFGDAHNSPWSPPRASLSLCSRSRVVFPF